MSNNSNLHKAKKAKNDEFYTMLPDIENELRHYRDHFKGKVVYCNCDDARESNFFKYFSINFEFLGLKKLITTGYKKDGHGVMLVYEGDKNGNKMVDDEEVQVTELEGDGDFRSPECVKLLDEADVVVTNPPFSLFREYVAQLVEHGKKFLVIGNMNALACKEIFPLVKNNKMWLGLTWVKEFKTDDGKTQKFGNIVWYTNLDMKKRHEKLILTEKYDPAKYQKYDNYDAINVNKVNDIPKDWDGVMGVPITFLDKYNPEQFEILGSTQRGCHDEIPDTRKYDDYLEMRPDGTPTGSTGVKTNGNPNLEMNDRKKNYFINKDGRTIQSLYNRVFIKRKPSGENEADHGA